MRRIYLAVATERGDLYPQVPTGLLCTSVGVWNIDEEDLFSRNDHHFKELVKEIYPTPLQ